MTTGGRCEKRAHILISSSTSGSESLESSELEYEFHGDAVDTCSSTSRESDSESDGNEWSESDDERGESSGEFEEVKEEDIDHHFCRIMHLLRGKCDPHELKLEECKSYLRKHGLRVSGTKEECIERIIEHWRIKDGNGERFYPRSSFNIDCTGDVCKGDVVVFKQKVYKNFDKMTRRGAVLGKRTVAGRIVKESYGAAKQQHTFTVEVLWSKGVKKLPPLYPLLVKGRNLYKLKTCRQRWKNEKERFGVLSEKHSRGAAARLVRKTRKMRQRKRKQSFVDKGAKKQKHDQIRPSQVRQSTRGRKSERENQIHECGSSKSSTYHHGVLPQTAKSNVNKGRKFKSTSSHQRPSNYANANQVRENSFHPFATQSDKYRQSRHSFSSDTYNQRMPYSYPYNRAYVSSLHLSHGSSSSSVMDDNRKQRKYDRGN